MAVLVACNSTPPPQTKTQTEVQAYQVPIPATAAQVPGPPAGTAMTKEYVQAVGRMAYLWGWPLVNNAHRHAAFSQAPEPGLMGGVLPIAHNALAMLINYVARAIRKSCRRSQERIKRRSQEVSHEESSE